MFHMPFLLYGLPRRTLFCSQWPSRNIYRHCEKYIVFCGNPKL